MYPQHNNNVKKEKINKKEKAVSNSRESRGFHIK
jgi:hypothetical protein